MINKLKINQLKESYLFYFVLLINLCILSYTRFYPSMDGPAHLYNSNLIKQLLLGNNSLSDFYTIHSFTIPNWTSHAILSFFHLFLPAWICEKILVGLYIGGMALSFRYLIKKLNPQNTAYSFFIFPFIYTFLFHLGFYNYNISFILFFSTLAFWLKNHETKSSRSYIVIFLLLTVTYFSNILTYCFLGLMMGSYVLINSYQGYVTNKNCSVAIKTASKKLLGLFLVSLPTLIAMLAFYKSVTFFPSHEKYEIKELVKWLNDVRPLIVYDYKGEEVITAQYLHILLGLFAIAIFIRLQNFKNTYGPFLRKHDILILPLIIATILYFFVPNGADAGMMSDRYCLMVYFLALIWILSQSVPQIISRIAVTIVILLHFGLLFKHTNGTIRNLDKQAVSINQSSKYIKDNSIVLPVNLSDNWIDPHFSNYLGVDKPMVILENYEANLSWFPVIWNSKKIPNILLGDKTSVSDIHWISNPSSMVTRQIQYILLFGNMKNIDEPKWVELKGTLATNFKLIYASDNKYAMLFEMIN